MSIPVLAAGAAIGTQALRFVNALVNRVFRHQAADSLVSFTKSTRVEPITIIDQRVVHLPYIQDILQSASSIFIGYYLQAVSLAVNVGSINVLRLLDTLNPSRDVTSAASTFIGEKVQSLESVSTEAMDHQAGYLFGLPRPAPAAKKMRMGTLNLESVHDVLVKGTQLVDRGVATMNKGDQLPAIKNEKDSDKMFNVGLNDAVKDAINLSVGKLIEVTVESDGRRASFPISVRLIATQVASKVLTHILGDGSRNTSAVERYHSWKSGEISFWDMVTCQDLIDAHKKTLAKDDSGVYDAILARRSNNQAASAFSNSPSVGTASNIVVLSSQTAKELESSIHGRLNNPRTRKKIFDSTYIMLMIVIDPEWEHVTIYHRGIALPTQLSVKELKTANKGSGPDIAEILKAYQLGQTPSI